MNYIQLILLWSTPNNRGDVQMLGLYIYIYIAIRLCKIDRSHGKIKLVRSSCHTK